MGIKERRAYIISRLGVDDAIKASTVAQELGVSEITIRRDFHFLEAEGILQRTHGAASIRLGRSYEPPLSLRITQNLNAKQAIGRKAAKLVKEGDCISLDVGSTTLEIARNLLQFQNLTVITPGLHIANILSKSNFRVILTGGVIRNPEGSLIGELARIAFDNFYVDKLFLAIGGIDTRAGLTEYNLEDALVKKAMINHAKQVIVVADSSKFDRVTFSSVATFSEIHRLITNRIPYDDLKKALIEHGVKIDLCSSDE